MKKRRHIQLSVVIIAKDEEVRIARAIESVKFANEIIVIDNGSNDATVAKARRCGARCIVHKTKSFAELRNIGNGEARGVWLLYLDADERIPQALAREIQTISKQRFSLRRLDEETVCYYIQRKNQYLGHPWPTLDRMQRLFYREALVLWEGAVHETARVKGKTAQLTNFLNHDTHRTLEQMVEKTNEWSAVEAVLRHRVHHPPVAWWRLIRVMITGFFQSYIREKGYLAGSVGLIESLYQGFSMVVTYVKLWELQKEIE